MLDTNKTHKSYRKKEFDWRQFEYQMTLVSKKVCLPNQNRDIFHYCILINSFFDIQKATLTTIRYPLAVMRCIARLWQKQVNFKGTIISYPLKSFSYYSCLEYLQEQLYKLSFLITSSWNNELNNKEYATSLMYLQEAITGLVRATAFCHEFDEDLTIEKVNYLAVKFAKEYLIENSQLALKRYQDIRKKYIKSMEKPLLNGKGIMYYIKNTEKQKQSDLLNISKKPSGKKSVIKL